LRRRADPPLASADRWLLSWSDFVTLLLALFAAMYAGASVDRAKSEAVARSVGAALGAPAAEPQPMSKGKGGDQGTGHSVSNEPESFAREISDALSALGLGERVRVGIEGGTIAIDIDAGLLFREGDAALSDEARALMTDIAQLLREKPYEIRVEGHTDSRPISNERYVSNWELSSARAAVVVRQLAATGIGEGRLTAVGMAANRPIGPNDTPEGRARNRRVQLVLLKQGKPIEP